MIKKTLSLVLAVALVLSGGIVPAFADEAVPSWLDNISFAESSIVLDRSTYPLAVGTVRAAGNPETYTSGDKIRLFATVDPGLADQTITWTSDDPSIAYIDGEPATSAVVGAARTGVATITATASNGDTATCVIVVIDNYDRSTVLSVALNTNSLVLVPGAAADLLADITPWDAQNKDMTWSSSDKTVAEVDTQGHVTAVAAGTATITVETVGSQRIASCDVTVAAAPAVPVTGVQIDKTESTLTVGETEFLGAVLLPETSANAGLIWSSTAPAIVGVDQTGLVTAYAPTAYELADQGILGVAEEAVVQVTTEEGGFVASCKYTVRNVEVPSLSVSLSASEASVPLGGSVTLTGVIGPANVTDRTIAWESTDETVVKVAATENTAYDAPAAVVTAVGVGSARVVAKNGGSSASCEIVVTENEVLVGAITLSETDVALTVDAIRDLDAALAPASATNKRVKWESSNPSVVTVDPNDGTLMAFAPGTAVVRVYAADAGTAEATATVRVTHGNKYLRNLTAPAEAVTDNSALLLWNRDEGTQIADHTMVKIYVDGVYAGNSLRSQNDAKDVLAIAKDPTQTGSYGNKMGYRVRDLAPDTEYAVRADALNTAGQVVASESLKLRTKPAPTAVVDVTQAPYGARGDGVATDTYAIQRAINDCPPGGMVVLPKGYVFLSGAVFLKSDIIFRVDGILLGSTNPKDYPKISTRWEGWRKVDRGYLENSSTILNKRAHASLVVAGTYDEGENTLIGPFNVSHFSIVGEGQINANGYRLGYHEGMNAKTPRPDPLPPQSDATVRGRAVTFHNAQDVYVADVSIAYSPSWSMHAIYSDTITFDGLDLIAKGPNKSATLTASRTADGNTILNGDGINPDSSSNINVFDVYFCTGDDCVTLKSGRNGQGWTLNKPTKYVRTTDCSSIGSKGGFCAGSEIAGGVNNVLFQNMYVEDISLDAIWIKTRWSRGGVIENIVYRDLMTTGTGSTAVLISITYSSSDNNPAGEKTGAATGVGAPPLIRNLTFENIVAWGTGGNNSFAFQGIAAGNATVDGVRWTYPVSRIQNVVIRNSSSSRSNSSLSYVDGFTSYNVKVANTNGLFSSANSLNVTQNAREHVVSFAAGGGSAVQTQVVPEGGKIPEIPESRWAEHWVTGWYADAALTQRWDFETDVVTEPITLYAAWTTDADYLAAVKALDSAAARARSYINPAIFTDVSWAVFANALQAAEAAPSGVSSAELWALAGALERAIEGLVPRRQQFQTARVYFTGPADATVDQPVKFTVSLGDVENLGTVRVRFRYDSDRLALDKVEEQNGFSILNVTSDTVTLCHLDGVTTDEAKPVLELHFTPKAPGAAAVEIVSVEAASYYTDQSGAADLTVDLAASDAIAVTVRDGDRYDFNRDGQLSLADLAAAQLWYMEAIGGSNWARARAADIDGNGVINVGDFIDILTYLTQHM
ncbi:MAG: Ig-like domain-containing protein [Oscillospiraceae bacterium]|nr:Ig-like domain-containing protein [Oscillospiraceae bacterium]